MQRPRVFDFAVEETVLACREEDVAWPVIEGFVLSN
jgi:hypothetical protein